MEEQQKKLLQWHAAFFAGIQIELEEEAENLYFENEHMLGTKPMQIDVLIIKKDAEKGIHKNIGQVFRKYNLMEYKSPDDYLSINDFNKVLGYAYFYMADTAHVKEIQSEEVSISYVCSKYPRELIKYLLGKGRIVEKKEQGIYFIYGEPFAIQIVINPLLSEETNLWLKNLSNKINSVETAERLIREYERKKESKWYSSIMDIVVRANGAKFSEVKHMCEALKDLFKEELQESWNEGHKTGISQGTHIGVITTLVQLVRDGLLSLSVAAERAQMTTEEFQKILE